MAGFSNWVNLEVPYVKHTELIGFIGFDLDRLKPGRQTQGPGHLFEVPLYRLSTFFYMISHVWSRRDAENMNFVGFLSGSRGLSRYTYALWRLCAMLLPFLFWFRAFLLLSPFVYFLLLSQKSSRHRVRIEKWQQHLSTPQTIHAMKQNPGSSRLTQISTK